MGLARPLRLFPILWGCWLRSAFFALPVRWIFYGLHIPSPAALGVPAEVLPLGLLRPLTGTGSLAYTTDLIRVHGPDSLIGMIASTIQGSTDTTLYVLTVYFGAVGVRNGRYALKVGLFSDVVGFVAAIAVCLLLFG